MDLIFFLFHPDRIAYFPICALLRAHIDTADQSLQEKNHRENSLGFQRLLGPNHSSHEQEPSSRSLANTFSHSFPHMRLIFSSWNTNSCTVNQSRENSVNFIVCVGSSMGERFLFSYCSGAGCIQVFLISLYQNTRRQNEKWKCTHVPIALDKE